MMKAMCLLYPSVMISVEEEENLEENSEE